MYKTVDESTDSFSFRLFKILNQSNNIRSNEIPEHAGKHSNIKYVFGQLEMH